MKTSSRDLHEMIICDVMPASQANADNVICISLSGEYDYR